MKIQQRSYKVYYTINDAAKSVTCGRCNKFNITLYVNIIKIMCNTN